MTRALRIAAAKMAERLRINQRYRKALEECGDEEVVLPLDEFFGPKEREALAAYDAALNEINGAQPLPLEIPA